ncbi:substrate-binding domain-containing protein, partial [Pseudomonas aeruginosa]|uniref:substrate-binding domain-containing protein n=1 Tax=Pseudomonas aeruginosa TaxID=287 RepID=UPI002E79DEAA
PDAEARTTYVIKELNDKGIKTEQLQLDTAMWDTAQAKDKMDAWLSGPNANKIEVVIANNDAMAMGAVEALKAHNKSSIPVFGIPLRRKIRWTPGCLARTPTKSRWLSPTTTR